MTISPSLFTQFAAAPPSLTVGSRRWFLQAGMAGVAASTFASRAWAANSTSSAARSAGGPSTPKKSVILFWLSGGPSHIDMWDPKPDAPQEIRGPYGVIQTKIPGAHFCEHLPLQASIADKLSIVRSVDCRASNHTPITMQAGNPLARRTDDGRDGAGYPSMGSVVAKFRGPNHPQYPSFVGLADSWVADVWEAGDLGKRYAPLKGNELAGKFGMPPGIQLPQLTERDGLRRAFDRLGQQLDGGSNLDRHTQDAFEMVLSGGMQRAFDVSAETPQMRAAYGDDSLGQKALLARRLVEAGVTFVLVSGAWGYFDHHGDNVKWGGIVKGLTPLLPRVDRTLFTLVTDLEERGLLDSTLIIMMGEFGRSPTINKEAGRDHWTNVMSLVLAGGGLRHGQVIGATDSRGGDIQSSPVRPQDLAATTYRHLGIDLQTHWINSLGRPIPIVTEGGRPIPELF